MEKRENKDTKYLVIGFLIGFGSFMLYDLLTRENDLKNIKKNLIDLNKESKHFLLGIKKYFDSSKAFRKGLKSLDNHLGINLYSFIKSYTPPKEDDKPKKKKQQFFKIKKH